MENLGYQNAEYYCSRPHDRRWKHQCRAFYVATFVVLLTIIFRAPPCICDWRAVGVIRLDELNEVKSKYDPPWYARLRYPHLWFATKKSMSESVRGVGVAE